MIGGPNKVPFLNGERVEMVEPGEAIMIFTSPRPAGFEPCHVYWGSHGCKLERGHDGPHLCDCADDPGIDPETREYVEEPGVYNVGAPPYYGPETIFFGEDTTASERGEA